MARQNPYRIRYRKNRDTESRAQVQTKQQATEFARLVTRSGPRDGRLQLEALNPRPGRPHTWQWATVAGEWTWVPIAKPTSDPREIRDQVRAARAQREGQS